MIDALIMMKLKDEGEKKGEEKEGEENNKEEEKII